MPNVSLVGQSEAGGVISGPGSAKMSVAGLPVSLVGDDVNNHGPGLHAGPKMVSGSAKMTVGGIPVVIQGSAASCGHTASGNPKMVIGS
ncbi:hypothetical protein FDI21_gp167 [Pseudomonas phage Noxifer]|uniref:Uncharacterized protein n=1 Tax=Pseudomonas phage Noxifer TaxID=2006684 RepID=A0A1Y0T074_9CAUD|nr:hypothetical protein FDI21_gp167 [Pseudomonas phage Noxifer]ARV77336.1 hypothetical protein NOXIFER_167 [Pseudomonas phage Noxifer]